MSPAGVPGQPEPSRLEPDRLEPSRLEVAIKRKFYDGASGGQVQVLSGLTLTLVKGQFGALVGPSGCGKTTLLRIIAGLDRNYEGTLILPDHGRLGVVFQEPRLLPWRTVEQNVRLAAPEATDAHLDQLFQAVGLAKHRNHFPGELSLGLARRVALVRAFAVKPDLLLLDEPFVSLDDALAVRLREELAELVTRSPVTTLLVTHDVEEAIELADRLFLLSASPTRVVAEVPIEHPRGQQTPEERETIRKDVTARLKAPPT